MKSVLVTGGNRGLGLGFVKHIAETCKTKYIIATCRDPESAKELNELRQMHPNLHILQAEMKDIGSIQQLARSVSDIVKEEGLNVLINNAGISTKFARLSLVKPEQLMECYQVNTVAPVIMAKEFLPLLKKAAKSNADKPLGASKAFIVNMSSILGSIAENTQGGYFPYRGSKTALNAATKSMSVDLKQDGIGAVSLHPGWVKTDLGGPGAPLDVDTSVSGMVELLLNLSEKHNGGFFDYKGKEIPW